MISIDEALAHVLEQAYPLPATEVNLHEALGHVLAENIASDVDSPPYDKSVVDGYAIRCTPATTEFEVLEEVVAGDVPRREVTAGMATRIMTGAPIPSGADAVVMVERTETIDQAGKTRVRIHGPEPRPAQNIMRRGLSMQRGQVVLQAGRMLGAIELGLLAEVGRSRLAVFPRPSVGVLATGNELVEAGEVPGPGQIRNSNGPMLAALVQSVGALPHMLGIARDTADDLRRAISAGLQHDVLLLSGGVSEGVLDLAPRVLTELGVRKVFHKVNVKPGKPLWFGVHETTAGRRTLVFGLPGNPVSSLVSFQLFVRPALGKLARRPDGPLRSRQVRLSKPHHQRGDRPTFWPVVWQRSGPELRIEPLAWQGSGDLRTLADADGLVYFPPGERLFAAGEYVEMRYWRD